MIRIAEKVRIDYGPIPPSGKSTLFQGLVGQIVRIKVRTKEGVTCVVKLDESIETENGSRYQWVYEEERFLRPMGAVEIDGAQL